MSEILNGLVLVFQVKLRVTVAFHIVKILRIKWEKTLEGSAIRKNNKIQALLLLYYNDRGCFES